MLTIPESLTIDRAPEDENTLLEAARDWLEREERTPGIHASDLLDPMKAYWKHVDPRPASDREVPIFLVGKILHAFVLGAMEGTVDLAKTDEGSSYSEELGIWYSPDWDKGEIAEFKSNRRFSAPRTVADLDSYVEQVLVYMVARNRTVAKLWLLCLNLRDEETRRTSPKFLCYTIRITPEDLQRVREELLATRALLETAIDARDPSGLPLCREWLCNPSMCGYWEQCKPAGRYTP